MASTPLIDPPHAIHSRSLSVPRFSAPLGNDEMVIVSKIDAASFSNFDTDLAIFSFWASPHEDMGSLCSGARYSLGPNGLATPPTPQR